MVLLLGCLPKLLSAEGVFLRLCPDLVPLPGSDVVQLSPRMLQLLLQDFENELLSLFLVHIGLRVLKLFKLVFSNLHVAKTNQSLLHNLLQQSQFGRSLVRCVTIPGSPFFCEFYQVYSTFTLSKILLPLIESDYLSRLYS